VAPRRTGLVEDVTRGRLVLAGLVALLAVGSFALSSHLAVPDSLPWYAFGDSTMLEIVRAAILFAGGFLLLVIVAQISGLRLPVRLSLSVLGAQFVLEQTENAADAGRKAAASTARLALRVARLEQVGARQAEIGEQTAVLLKAVEERVTALEQARRPGER
jgi:hypothetical protein